MLKPSSASESSLQPRVPASFIWQLWYALRRCVLVDVRYPRFIFIDSMLQMLPGIALAIPFLGKDQYSPPLPGVIAATCIDMIGDRCRAHVIDMNYFVTPTFYTTMIIGAAAQIYAVTTFGRPMAVYRREAGAGLHRTAYFLAKCIYDLVNITRCAWIFIAFNFLLNAPRGDFGLWFALIWLLFFAGYGVGYFVSFIVRFELSTTIAVCAGICFSVTSGLTPRITSVDKWGPLRVVWYLSYNRWGSEAMVILSGSGQPTNGRMEDAIVAAGYDASNLSLDLGMVFLIGLFWRTISAFIMWRKSK
jgi:ABC-type multidrug transport system permease subunit